MTTREQRMLVGLVGVGGVLGGGMLLYVFCLQPLWQVYDEVTAARAQLEKKQGELKAEEAKAKAVLQRDPRLAAWQQTSLPPAGDLYRLSDAIHDVDGLRVTEFKGNPLPPGARGRYKVQLKAALEGTDPRRPVAELLDRLREGGWVHPKATLPADLQVGNPVELGKALMQLEKQGVALKFTDARKLQMDFEVPRGREVPAAKKAELDQRHVVTVKGDYARYLRELLQKHSFATGFEVKPTDPRSAAPPKLPGNKGPAYERLAFNVSGQAKQDAVRAMLRDFYATPLLHQIYSVTLEQPPEKEAKKDPRRRDLKVNMTVEALMVPGAQERTALKPTGLAKPPRVLADAGRKYEDMAGKDIFYGEPYRERTRERLEEKPEDALRIKLTTISNLGRRWEASFYAQNKGGNEFRRNAETLNEIKIYDRYDNLVLEAKVAHIDGEQVVLRVGSKFYRLTCGDFLSVTLGKAMETSEVKALGLLSPGS